MRGVRSVGDICQLSEVDSSSDSKTEYFNTHVLSNVSCRLWGSSSVSVSISDKNNDSLGVRSAPVASEFCCGSC